MEHSFLTNLRTFFTGRPVDHRVKPGDDDLRALVPEEQPAGEDPPFAEPVAPEASSEPVKTLNDIVAPVAPVNPPPPVVSNPPGGSLYESFYGLKAKPFSLLPDSDFLFLSRRHKMAVNLLEYGMATQAGFIVISGEVGGGKTTVIRKFLRSAGDDVRVGVINNANKGFGRLLGWVAMAFEIEHRGRDYATLYNKFVEFLLEQYAAGRRTVLIIDEAQNFSAEILEELRMLSNVNNEKDQLLQIVLAGQPELLDTLKKPELRQFVQRIAVHCHLEPLDPSETAQYIRHRLSVAGGASSLFDDTACAAVYFFTGGVPRLINLLCDLSMVYGFSDELPRIGIDSVVDAVMDRNRTGLSPFKAAPEGVSGPELVERIISVREQITSREDEPEEATKRPKKH